MHGNGNQNEKSLNRQLIDAAVAGDIATVRRLLEEGVDAKISRADFDVIAQSFSAEDRSRHADVFTLIGQHSGQNRINAAMYLAAFHGFDDIVDHFLDKSAHDALTLKVAVFGAARAGRTDLVTRLIDAGAAADFKNDYPLRQSITAGHAETAKVLVGKTNAQSRAVGYAIAAGNVELAADFLNRNTDVPTVLTHIAWALGDAQLAGKGGDRLRDDAGILAGFQMILGFAEARGDDMQHVMQTVAAAAAKHEALPLINDIRWQRILQEIPDKQAVLTAMLLPHVPPHCTVAQYSDAMVRLIEDGADAEKGLMIGVGQSDVPMVDTALRQKVDPRRRREAVVKAARHMADKAVTNQAPAMEIFGSILAVEAMAMVMDEMTHHDGLTADDPLFVWRQVDDTTGKSGLMAVFAIGKIEDYLTALQNKGKHIPLADLLHQDKRGYRALDCLDDAGQLHVLFNRNLWENRREDYQALWQALTPSQQAENQSGHAEVMQRWQAEDSRRRVSDLARQHKGRFKL